MKCNKCGKEVQDEWEFCNYCGEKIERTAEKGKKLNKKIIYLVIGIIVFIFIFGIVMYINNNNSSIITNNKDFFSTEELQITETYKLNENGFFKSKKILNEEYNEKGDLVYVKYKENPNKTSEMKLSYEYDDMGRAIKITNNSYSNDLYNEYILIEYDDINRIHRVEYTLKNDEYVENNVTINRNVIRYIYDFNYENDFYVVNGYMTQCKYKEEGSHQFNNNPFYYTNKKDEVGIESVLVVADYYFFEKEINGEKYVLMIKIDSDENIIEKSIYKKEENIENQALRKLGFIPICYCTLDDLEKNINPYMNTLISYSPEYQIGKKIYTATSENILQEVLMCDNKNRILIQTLDNEVQYSMYIDVDANNYYRYVLGGEINGNKYLGTYKCSINNLGQIEENNCFKDRSISEKEYNDLKTKFITYIEENKQEIDIKVIFENELNNTVDELKSKILQDYLNFALIGDDTVYTDTTYPTYCYRTYPNEQYKSYTEIEGWREIITFFKNNSGFSVSDKGYYHKNNSTRHEYSNEIYILENGLNKIQYAYVIDNVNHFKDIELTFIPPEPLIKLEWSEDKSKFWIKVKNSNYEDTVLEYFDITVNGKKPNFDIQTYCYYEPAPNETEFNVSVKNEYGIVKTETISK